MNTMFHRIISPTALQVATHSVLLIVLLLPPASVAQSLTDVWFAKAGADGDGSSMASPLGSTETLEAVTGPGDVIMLLPAGIPLEGGLTLKDGQALIGLPETDRKCVITNKASTRNAGNGIVLANNNRVWNVRIENTLAGGILGANVSGAWIEEVEVVGANQSGAYTHAEMKPLGPLPQGGIVFAAYGADGSGVNRVIQSTVSDARGFGIASFAFGGAKSRLSVSSSLVEDGTRASRFDMGVAAIAEGPSSEIDVDLANARVGGRQSRVGRNFVVFASSDGSARARIIGSHLGQVGQDGVLGAAFMLPAAITLEIRDSIIEKAGQTNVEGTLLNLPPFDSSGTSETHLSIDIVNSTIRDAGFSSVSTRDELGFGNIWVGSSGFAQQLDPKSTSPFALGRYSLTVQNSLVEGASDFGVGIGNMGSRWGLDPEQSVFDVLLRENTITNNGSAAVLISAPKARIDARRNCWGSSEGLSDMRVLLRDTSARSQLDASEALPCVAPDSIAPGSRGPRFPIGP